MKLVGYIRVSKDSQTVSGLGLQAQRDTIKRVCRERGAELLRIEEDCGVSGSKEDRPGLNRCLRDLRAGLADGLIAAKMDRLTRSLNHFADLMRVAAKNNWSIIAVDVGVDTSNGTGRMIAGMLAVLAEFELGRISSRIKEALAASKARGTRLGAVRQVTDAALKRIEHLKGEGLSWRAIAMQLNTEGLSAPRGGLWHPATCQKALERHGKSPVATPSG